MNTARSTVYLALASLSLAACASHPDANLQSRVRSSGSGLDLAYVRAVNRASQESGVTVVWINPPRERDRKD